MPKIKSVNVGLIGAGRIGSFHGQSIARRLVDAELVAIADPAPGTAAKLAETLGVDAAYAEVSELLAHPGLDAVVIATPARFHTNVLVQAAEAGKAIFCEKPMALTLEDADRAIAAAHSAGVPLQVGFNRRWDQAFAEGRAAIDAGKIGAPQLIRSLTRDPGPFGAPIPTASHSGPFSTRRSFTTSTPCFGSMPAPSRSRFSRWPTRSSARMQRRRLHRHRSGQHPLRQRLGRRRGGELLGTLRL